MTQKLAQAIKAFEDETSKLTLGERIDVLRNALMLESFEAIKKGKEHEKTDIMKHFADLEKMYLNQLKLNKVLGKSGEQMNNEFLATIREMRSSIGSITCDINAKVNE